MCNGLVEKFNGSLKSMLKKLCSEQRKQWFRYINALLFAYREVPHKSTGFAPFELLYGRTVRDPMTILKQLLTKEIENPEVKTNYEYVFDLPEKLEETLSKIAQEELKRDISGTTTRPDLHRWQSPHSIARPTDKNKLLMQWKVPFVIETVVGINDYGIKIVENTNTSHANMLKEYIERQPTIQVHDQVGRRREENGSAIDSRSVLHVAGVAVIEQS